MRILVADDMNLMRDTLVMSFERLEPQGKIFTTDTFESALEIAKRERELDLILLDFDMDGMDGANGIRRMREVRPDVPVVLFSGIAKTKDVEEALDAGAAGYLPKRLTAASMFAAMRLIISGEQFVPVTSLRHHGTDQSSAHADRIAGEIAPAAPGGQQAAPASRSMPALTSRESQMVDGLQRGLSNREIGVEIGIAEETVKLHVRGLLKKFGARNRTEAISIIQKLRSRL